MQREGAVEGEREGAPRCREKAKYFQYTLFAVSSNEDRAGGGVSGGAGAGGGPGGGGEGGGTEVYIRKRVTFGTHLS